MLAAIAMQISCLNVIRSRHGCLRKRGLGYSLNANVSSITVRFRILSVSPPAHSRICVSCTLFDRTPSFSLTQDQVFHKITGFTGLPLFRFALSSDFGGVHTIDPHTCSSRDSGPRVGFHGKGVAIINLDYFCGHGASCQIVSSSSNITLCT